VRRNLAFDAPGDAPEETLFPFTSTVLQEVDSAEYKSCWTYMYLIEVINQTLKHLLPSRRSSVFIRGASTSGRLKG